MRTLILHWFCSAAAVIGPTLLPLHAHAQAVPAAGYGSLMTDRVDVRRAPGLDKPITVVFRRAGLPVEIVEQTKGWQRIRDAEGSTGWVPVELVSKRRTGLVLAQSDGGANNGAVALRVSERAGADAVALLEPGVIVGVVSCDGRVCRITTSGVRGIVDQGQLWGVGEGEIIR